MLLGDVLARFDDETVAAETILGLGDLALIARLRERAEMVGQSLGEYAAATVRCYAASAPDEEWITLMGALGRAENPGAVCMTRAFAYMLEQDAAVEGEHSACCSEHHH
jgi:hypothetical protein